MANSNEEKLRKQTCSTENVEQVVCDRARLFADKLSEGLAKDSKFQRCHAVVRSYAQLLKASPRLDFLQTEMSTDLFGGNEHSGQVVLMRVEDDQIDECKTLVEKCLVNFDTSNIVVDYGLTALTDDVTRNKKYLYISFDVRKKGELKDRDKNSAFKESFHKCLLSESSLYDGFVNMSERRLPYDAKVRYLRLRQSGFVMKDDSDIDAYTHFVARKHIPKFQWLYESLFRQYRSVFTAPIGLVIWGCGCGLDLIALYDQAMKEGNPNFWLVVKSIALIDISEPAMNRAKEIAEVLFPTAEIKTFNVDLRDGNQVERRVKLETLFPYLPRVHLLSNIIDLFDDIKNFASSVSRVCARPYPHEDGRPGFIYNEIFVAFSPDYRGGRVKGNMDGFRAAWGKLASDLTLLGDAPLNCEYAAFAFNQLGVSSAYKLFAEGNALFRRMLKKLPGYVDTRRATRFLKAVSISDIGGAKLFDEYEFADTLTFTNVQWNSRGNIPKERVETECKTIVLVAGIGKTIKPCIVFLSNKPDERMCNQATALALERFESILDDSQTATDLKRLKEVRSKFKNSASGSVSENPNSANDNAELQSCQRALMRHVLLTYCDYQEKPAAIRFCQFGEVCDVAERHNLQGDVDYSRYFVEVSSEVDRLPALTKEQRAIAESCKQLCKVKGGPGVGKTVTMLWHALKVVQRTHLPVLILCKTVSLINYNYKRLAATFLAAHSDQESLDKALFRFCTIDSFLCDYQKKSTGCILSRCAKCNKRCSRLKVLTFPKDRIKTEEDRKRNNEICVRFNCAKCSRSSDVKEVCSKLKCKGLTASELHRRDPITAEFLETGCRDCKASLIKHLRRRDRQRTWEESLGGVLIDEVQIVDPDFIKSVYNLTGAGNPWREFYVFCDAQQAFRHNTLEQDTDKKWNVKVPDSGFGNFEVLKENHRMKNRALIEACRIIQKKLKGRDEDLTFIDLFESAEDLKTGREPFGIKAVASVNFDFLEREVRYLREQCGAESVTVICDQEPLLRSFSAEAMANEWVVTHLPQKRYSDEKKRREAFFEHQGMNHLTSVDLSQGQSFESVIFVLSSSREQFDPGLMEQVFTALSRGGRYLRVFDASPRHWLYALLKGNK